MRTLLVIIICIIFPPALILVIPMAIIRGLGKDAEIIGGFLSGIARSAEADRVSEKSVPTTALNFSMKDKGQ